MQNKTIILLILILLSLFSLGSSENILPKSLTKTKLIYEDRITTIKKQIKNLNNKLAKEKYIFNKINSNIRKCESKKCIDAITNCISECYCVYPSCKCCWGCAKCLGSLFYECCKCVIPHYCPVKNNSSNSFAQ